MFSFQFYIPLDIYFMLIFNCISPILNLILFYEYVKQQNQNQIHSKTYPYKGFISLFRIRLWIYFRSLQYGVKYGLTFTCYQLAILLFKYHLLKNPILIDCKLFIYIFMWHFPELVHIYILLVQTCLVYFNRWVKPM